MLSNNYHALKNGRINASMKLYINSRHNTSVKKYRKGQYHFERTIWLCAFPKQSNNSSQSIEFGDKKSLAMTSKWQISTYIQIFPEGRSELFLCEHKPVKIQRVDDHSTFKFEWKTTRSRGMTGSGHILSPFLLFLDTVFSLLISWTGNLFLILK